MEITWGTTYDESTGQNSTGYFPTELRMHDNYISIYVTWMYLVFMYLIPFAALAIFNLLTWLEMRRALARRAALSSQELKEHNLATMLLVVVLVFFICNLLPLVVNIMELVVQINNQLIQVSNFLVTINSSVNILIYCTFGKKFRTVFMQIFFGKQPPCINITTSRSIHHQKRFSNANSNGTIETLPLNSFRNSPKMQNNAKLKNHQEICETDQDQDAIIYASDQKSVGVQAKLI